MPPTLLTPRWAPLRANAGGSDYSKSMARFNVVPAGRRSGKTERAKRKWIRRALEFGLKRPDIHDGYFIFGAPTFNQARSIFWNDLKMMIPRSLMLKDPGEQAMSIKLVTGVELHCVGFERPERHEGRPIDGGVLDEYGNMKPEVWTHHLRPALSTLGREGGLDFIGVPEGRNHYYDLYQMALKNEDGDWAAFTWTSESILTPKEIAAAKRDLDELTYRQEFLAEFVTFAGQAYYTFNAEKHLYTGLPYDDTADLAFCFDFNRTPGVAVVVQDHYLPHIVGHEELVTCVLGEVYIKQNSNTPKVCERLLTQWKNHRGRVCIYGDSTGGNKTTAAIMGSDYDLIEQMMRPIFGPRLENRVVDNPPERSRVNSMNSRLMSVDGTVRMLFERERTVHTVRDIEGVRVLETGELDKSDPLNTHSSDALGYFVWAVHPLDLTSGSASLQIY